MQLSSLLSIVQNMLETAAFVRSQYVMARAYGDVQGMGEALETGISIDEDLVSLLTEVPFQPLEISGRKKATFDSPEEAIEFMRTLMRLESAAITSQLRTIPGELMELEERRQAAVRKKIQVVGNYFRMLKRVLKERWDYWDSSYEREFAPMLRLGRKQPKKKRRK